MPKSFCSASKTKPSFRMKYSEVTNANNKFDRRAWWQDPRNYGRLLRTMSAGGKSGRNGIRSGRPSLRKIGRARRISRRQDHLRLARSGGWPIARLTSLLHGWPLFWHAEQWHNPEKRRRSTSRDNRAVSGVRGSLGVRNHSSQRTGKHPGNRKLAGLFRVHTNIREGPSHNSCYDCNICGDAFRIMSEMAAPSGMSRSATRCLSTCATIICPTSISTSEKIPRLFILNV